MNELDANDGSTKSVDVQSVDKVRKYAKRKKVAKAFSLDVVWDYILIVFKKRTQSGRLVIILFLFIVLICKTSPYGEYVFCKVLIAVFHLSYFCIVVIVHK